MVKKPLVVAKVGGSLFDFPDLRVRLMVWMDAHSAEQILIIPGGGSARDAVREFQVVHGLDETAAHWLAVRAMSLNAHVLAALLELPIVSEVGTEAAAVLDVHPFLVADESRVGTVEQSWNATSDSIAARVALVQAGRLTLVKSVDLPAGMSWERAAAVGLVDAAFPNTAAGVSVEWINLRAR